MKILYVITGLGQGGAERVVCDLADSMCEKGNEVKIVYLTGEVLTRPVNSEVELIKIYLNNLSSLPVAYINLKNIIKKFQPDVLHAHMVHANILTRLVRLTTPIKKLICTAHSANEGGGLRTFLYRVTHFLSDMTTNVSDFASQAYIRKKAVPRNGIVTIYNGVNFNNFKYDSSARSSLEKEFNLDPDVKIILAVGRFHKAKNYPNLLKAVNLIKESNSFSFKLLIAGDGDLRIEIENLINNLNLNNHVVLLGRRNDIPKLMSGCDVFVLSSDYEGLPTVLIEAMACQAQVVATNVSGVKEIVDKYGEIIPTNNSKDLSNSIIKVISVSATKNISGANYVRAKFDLENISKLWLDKYRNS